MIPSSPVQVPIPSGGVASDDDPGVDDADTIHAGGGNDVVRGEGGDDDSIWVTGDDDILYGGSGNDTVTGGEGSDRIMEGLGPIPSMADWMMTISMAV